MVTKPQSLALAVAGILTLATVLSAHHRWPVNRTAEVTVKGTVTAYSWANPHVMIGLDVRADDGSIEKWEVGGPSINRMAANGWDRNTLKPGEAITAVGFPFSDGARIMRLERVVKSDGTTMLLYGSR